MNPKLKKILSFLFIALSIGIVVMIAFSNPELGSAWKAISSLSPWWLAGILLCWVCYTFFEGVGTWLCLRNSGFRPGLGRVLSAVMLGFYYSNITPSAAGGQPMEVHSLRKAGVPVGIGTMAVTIRLASNQFTICLLSLILFLAHHDFVLAQLGDAVWFARVGLAINSAVVPIVLLAAFRRKWIQTAANRLIAFGHRLRLIRNPEAAVLSVTETLDTYHSSMKELMRSPGQILLQLASSAASLLGLTGSVFFVYHAFGMAGVPFLRLLTLSCLLFVSASYTPLPGASGAQEGGFLVYFRGIFTNGTIGLALLTWRFFTYYIFLLTGVMTLGVEKLLNRRPKKQEQA